MITTEGHNYDKLTPEQIGEGHALLAVGDMATPGYQFWYGGQWKDGRDFGYVVDPRDKVTRRARV